LKNVNLDNLPKPQGGAPTPTLKEVNAGLDTASATTPQRAAES
jgi:protein-tyrosine phosphatase